MPPEGRNEGANTNGARVCEELCHFGDASDVFVAISRRKSEVAAKTFADVVAVKAVAHDA